MAVLIVLVLAVAALAYPAEEVPAAAPADGELANAEHRYRGGHGHYGGHGHRGGYGNYGGHRGGNYGHGSESRSPPSLFFEFAQL